jgi:uncharacterized membrane protein YiaA
MSNQEQNLSATSKSDDSMADAFAAIAIIALVVGTVVYWLHSM